MSASRDRRCKSDNEWDFVSTGKQFQKSGRLPNIDGRNHAATADMNSLMREAHASERPDNWKGRYEKIRGRRLQKFGGSSDQHNIIKMGLR